METRIVTITDKGQVSIPIAIQQAANMRRGERLLVQYEAGTITMRKATVNKHSEPTVRPVDAFYGILKDLPNTWKKEEDGAHTKRNRA